MLCENPTTNQDILLKNLQIASSNLNKCIVNLVKQLSRKLVKFKKWHILIGLLMKVIIIFILYGKEKWIVYWTSGFRIIINEYKCPG